MSVNDSGNGNLLVAEPATLSQTATIQSLSFYVTTASGNLRLGIYDPTGPGGRPGAKKVETASITPTTGWNTANVITPVSLPVGTYWLAYLASSSSLGFKAESTGGNSKLYRYTFGTMPATFSTAPGSALGVGLLYATLHSIPRTRRPPPPPPPPPPTTSKFVIGDTVQATASINVRGTPGGTLLYTQPMDALGTVIAGSTQTPNGVIWWQIDYDSGTEGWSGEDNLVKYTP